MKSMTKQRSKVTINRPKNIQKKGQANLIIFPVYLININKSSKI